MSHQFNQITPTDHFSWHSAYLEIYHKLFSPFKEEAITLLEIGTDGGGGLRMYQDYFPTAWIFGMDISPSPESVKANGITHYQMDAYTAESVDFWNRTHAKFTVIIDDGPHTLGSQEFFVQNYPNLLAPAGIAIVEDIQEYAHAQHLASLVPAGFFSSIVDLRHVNGRYDDLLLLIWRK